MHRKGVAEARLGDAPVEDGEVGRMKNAVARTRHGCRGHQHHVVLGDAEQYTGQCEQYHAAEQHRPRTDAIDDEPCRRLPDAGDDEKHRHQRPGLGEVHVERRHQPREEQRDDQMEEVRNRVHEAHQ